MIRGRWHQRSSMKKPVMDEVDPLVKAEGFCYTLAAIAGEPPGAQVPYL